MKRIGLLIIVGTACTAAAGGDDPPTRTLTDRTQRGTLHDAALMVRGDSGRWSDAEVWVHAPPPKPTSAGLALDDCVEQWSSQAFESTAADGQWLLLRTKQLNDNDRVWVERIERRGNRITVQVNQATWRGKYQKNFTYYQVFGVNLGRLEPGTYQAVCVISPSTFTTFTGTGKPQDNWPKDELPADRKPLELSLTLTVGPNAR